MHPLPSIAIKVEQIPSFLSLNMLSIHVLNAMLQRHYIFPKSKIGHFNNSVVYAFPCPKNRPSHESNSYHSRQVHITYHTLVSPLLKTPNFLYYMKTNLKPFSSITISSSPLLSYRLTVSTKGQMNTFNTVNSQTQIDIQSCPHPSDFLGVP